MALSVSPERVHVHYEPLGAVDERIARELGMQVSTLRQALKPAARESWASRLAAAVRIMADAGQRERAELIAAPVLAALNDAPAPELCNAILLDESDTEAALDQARARYMLDPTHDHAHAYIAALHRHEAKERLVELAMRQLQSD